MATGPEQRRELKLTLRTLLAWMDDALPPEEARNIGQKVAESQVARDLIARIQKVVRRRKLTVPSSTGPEALDANLVASYLDNELPAAQVPDFEDRCLHNDVLLCEVASAHQILSMIGQKAKVPGEAKYRMYQLVRGREATGRAPVRNRPAASSARTPSPKPDTSRPRPAAIPVVGHHRPWNERLAPLAALAALIALMFTSAYWLTRPKSSTRQSPAPGAVAVAERPEAAHKAPPIVAERPDVVPADAAKVATADPATRPTPPTAIAAAPPAEDGSNIAIPPNMEAAPSAVAEAPATAEAAPTPAPESPSRSFTVVDRPGILLKDTPDKPGGVPLQAGAALAAGDRILGLAPYRTAFRDDKIEVELVGPAQLEIQRTGPRESARFLLMQGRIVLSVPVGATLEAPVAILAGASTLLLTPPAGGKVAITRVDVRPEGATSVGPALLVTNLTGDLTLTSKGKQQTVGPNASARVEPDGSFSEWTEPVPKWLVETEPSQADSLLGRDFGDYFKPDRTLRQSLGEALVAEDVEMQRLAISALGSTGQADLILPLLLNDETNPSSLHSALDVLREMEARGPESSGRLGQLLDQAGGADWSRTVGKLLHGFTSEEAKSQATYGQLIKSLEDPSLCIRTLAIENLTRLTRRDPLGYDPLEPRKGPGLTEWQKLLRNGELGAARAPDEAPVAPAEPSEKPVSPKASAPRAPAAGSTPRAGPQRHR
jgi:hypothetical protein